MQIRRLFFVRTILFPIILKLRAIFWYSLRKKVILRPEIKAFSIVLVQVISRYLESHKRLVVPQLGAFVVKEPAGSILFSELLKRDDGVLRGLLVAEGVGELEAAGEVDRFVFEVRHAVEQGEEYRLERFGTFRPGANGTISFIPEPPAMPSELPEPDKSPARDEQPGTVAPAFGAESGEPHLTASVKRHPDPSLRGLRYGKPHKSTDVCTFVGHAPRRRVDRFVWIAVIAVVVAVAAIAFGFLRDSRARKAEEQLIEVPQQPQPAPAASQQAE